MSIDERHENKEQVKTTGILGVIANVKNYLFMWLASTGLIASTAVCPFCGQAGCPVGFGQAAGLGLFSTVVLAVLMKLGIKKPTQAHSHVHSHSSCQCEQCCPDQTKKTD